MKDRNGKKIAIGDKVLWYDPEEEARDLTRVWEVAEIYGEIVLIVDGGEAEVFPEELEKITKKVPKKIGGSK